MVDATHSSGIEVEGKVLAGGDPAGFVIECEKTFTVYHAGDTGLFGDMKLIAELYRPDLALLPIGGYFTMGPREAAKACELIQPRFIVGMHYGTYPILSGTPEELKKYLPAKLKGRVRVLQPGVPCNLA
jgi:L-ascorbate metabolism protein UlaG (beta-lactamase superfamily)